MIEIESIGAAKTVTGSKHLLRTSRATVLLDCGLFQGHRKEANEKNQNFPIDTKELDAVVLSHAHIDHSGALPCLLKKGYRGPIYATPATSDLCLPMLMDTASLMQSDADHIQRIISRGGEHHLNAAEVLYDKEDVKNTISHFVELPYHKKQEIAPGIFLTFINAGHILGSAICILDVEDDNQNIRLAFTGDLGRKHLPILRAPDLPKKVSFLMMESTYGDRLHEKIEFTTEKLVEIINKTYNRGGKIIIPSFALERAQEIIFALKKLHDQKKIPEIPVYVDSPLTVKVTDVFKKHPECYDEELFEQLKSEHSPFDFKGLKYISSTDDSKRISALSHPCIVISANGMCEGGRILHHLIATIEDPKNSIIIVGYQAEHTLGRRIVEKQPEVKIYGKMYRLLAEVFDLNGFSGHADQNDLVDFALNVKKEGNLQKIILVHGETKAQETLKVKLTEERFNNIFIPGPGEIIKLG